MIEIDTIKKELAILAKEHDAIPDDINELKEAEWIESLAEDLIINYCEKKGYQVQGFPHEKRKVLSEEEADEYFCQERYRLYLDILALEKEDVADLLWTYQSLFYMGIPENKDEYLRQIKSMMHIHDITF